MSLAASGAIMNSVEKASQDVLVVGGGVPALGRVVPLLERAAFTVRHVDGGAEALSAIGTTAFDLIIVRHPLAGATLSEVVEAVRAPGSSCRAAGLLLIADASAEREVGAFLVRGVNRIVSVDASSDRLLSVVAELLAVAPRHAVRTAVRLSLWCEGQAGAHAGETVNISRTGMLVIAHARPPVGSGLAFELSLPAPAGPVRGTGEVVRHAAEPGEPDGAFAIRFVSFSGAAWEQLARFLDES